MLVAVLIDTGEEGTWAESLLSRDGSLYAPELAPAEVTNILRRLERAKKISTPEANAAQEDLMELELTLFPFAPFAARIWELRHTVTSYDAWYVAVAEGLSEPLATLDVSLSTASGPLCEFLTPFR